MNRHTVARTTNRAPVSARYSVVGADQGRCAAILKCCVSHSVPFPLARLAVRSGRSKDLEIVVLRHQLTVLRRQANRPQLNNDDRTRARRDRSGTPPAPTRRLARHPRHPAAMAPTTNRPPLDGTSPTTGTSIHFSIATPACD